MALRGKKLQKAKDDAIAYEKSLTTKELIEYCISLAAGDDYDGCFTHFGDWEFNYMKEQLFKRLETQGIK
jgi:hypothetical protein